MKLYIEIEKSFPKIEKLFENKDILKEFMQCDYDNLSLYHFGLGTSIRNNLLKEKSSLYQSFLHVDIVNRDDMSSLVIRLFYIFLKTKYK